MDLTARIATSFDAVDARAWDALDHAPSPFLEAGFLRALEASGSVGPDSGWAPYYVVIEADATRAADDLIARTGEGSSLGVADSGNTPPGRAAGATTPEDLPGSASPIDQAPTVLGAAALYRKTHSYGEYIFDFGWARASMAARVPYYPKLVAAAPMTPATGTRLLLHPSLHAEGATELRARVQRALVGATRALADELGCMSIHWLFCTRDEQAELSELGFFPRDTFQFHWRNREYADFDAFLAGLASRKRKQIRKERREAQAALDGPIEFVPGAALDARDLAALDRFYRRTCFEHGGSDYLRPGFFPALIEHLGHRVQFARARRGGRTIAGALYLQTEHALYGRYWGCDEDIPFLHFEAAYYAGIEHAIAHGLQLFEAGAQGEHKLLRGFAPAPTYSAHWLRHPGLREAVAQFLAQERVELEPYLEELARFTPFRRG